MAVGMTLREKVSVIIPPGPEIGRSLLSTVWNATNWSVT
jgi:hypothetical protein